MYYSKTAALDRHVCELHKIITKIEPKAPQPNASTENKCKMSRRELNNRIERLVLLAYTLRRKSSNEPFVPATEQEWAHLYMNGMCVKKYYTCQGRQVYVPKKIADSNRRGCSSGGGKYDKYLTDCGDGKGKGGGGGNGGSGGGSGGPVSNYLNYIVRLTDETSKNQQKMMIESIKKDIKIFNNRSANAFFPDSEMKITYENLLFIIGLILGLNDLINQKEYAEYIYDLSRKNSRTPQEDSVLENYTNDGNTIPIDDTQNKKKITKYKELLEKANDKFEELKIIPQNDVQNKQEIKKNEKDFVLKILEFLDFKDNNNQENTLKEFNKIVRESEQKNKDGNAYAKVLPIFLENYKPPLPPIESNLSFSTSLFE